MPLINRRRFVGFCGAGLLGLGALRFGLPRLLRHGPPVELSDEALAYLDECFAGIDRTKLWDCHAHLLGLGAGGTGCYVNPAMRSQRHPLARFQFDLYRAGAGMQDESTADRDYIERLLELHRRGNPAGKLLLLGLDHVVDESGQERPELSPFHTPNDYLFRIVGSNPDTRACASIHPYRADAVDRLERAAAHGACAVKWLPNAMGLDPASPRCDAFYRKLADLRLPLLCHSGKEYAVDSARHQALGNPLRLRRALDAGVSVIAAHAAGQGSFPDLDAADAERERLLSFDLFMRLFTERQYERTLTADISALTQVHRGSIPLRELIMARELHPRLLYGSDYPLPALRYLVSTRKLQFDGFLDARARRICNEIFDANPLLFDFVVTRSLTRIEHGRGYRFLPAVFETETHFMRGRFAERDLALAPTGSAVSRRSSGACA